MTLLSDAELASIRTDVLTMLPDTCNIMTRSLTSDGAGGNEDTYGTAYAGVSCRLDYKTGVERIAGGAVQPFTAWTLTLPHNTTITENDRVQVGSNTFNVLEVDASKSWTASIRCRLERIA